LARLLPPPTTRASVLPPGPDLAPDPPAGQVPAVQSLGHHALDDAGGDPGVQTLPRLGRVAGLWTQRQRGGGAGQQLRQPLASSCQWQVDEIHAVGAQ
jgi:hypothetical protein